MDRSLLEAFGRRVRVGIVGGGTDSVIGRTHLIAMRADGLCDLVAGAMSVDPEIALSSGRQELLTTDRLTRAVLPQMLARPKGKIVVVGSATGLRGQPRRLCRAPVSART